MDYEEYTGAEDQEFAEPETAEAESVEEGAEGQEPAEPVNSPDTAGDDYRQRQQDAAFAEMRRQYEEASRRAQMVSAQLERTTSVLREMGFKGDTDDYVIDSAIAHMQGRPVEDVRNERLRAAQEEARMSAVVRENQELRQREIRRVEDYDLNVFQKIDPSLRSMDDVVSKYPEFISAIRQANPRDFENPLFRETLFRAAAEAKTSKQAATPPKIGKVDGDSKTERDYFTNKELDNLSGRDLDDPAVLDKAIKSLRKLKTK